MLWWVMMGCVEPMVGSFLGELPGTDARIGVALEVDEVTVYFAGGETSLATHTRWFTGRRTEEDTFDATTDGWEVSGHVDGAAVFGDLIDPDGILVPWNVAPPIDAASLDGVWSGPADAGACRPGVILYNSAFNVQGGYCPAAGEIVPVSKVDLDTEDAVIDLQGDAPAGAIPFEATPVFPLPE